MPFAAKLWLKRVLICLVAAALLVLLTREVADVIGFSLGLSVLLLELIGSAILVVGMPFFFWIVGESVYRTYLKPYVRAFRINRIRHTRELREAVERGHNAG
jgi:hypothetical protein